MFRFIEVEFIDSVNSDPSIHQNDMKLPFSTQPLQSARIVSNRPLSSPDAVKTYMELELEPEPWFEYQPGDSLGLVCNNPETEVLELCRILGLESRLNASCSISVLKETKKARAKIPEFVSTPTGLKSLLETSLDIRSVPKKLFLRSLSEFTSNPEHKRRIEELCSKQVQSIYYNELLFNVIIIYKIKLSYC